MSRSSILHKLRSKCQGHQFYIKLRSKCQGHQFFLTEGQKVIISYFIDKINLIKH